MVATESDRSKLRAKLKDAVNKVPNSFEYNYWVGRTALLAGDYDLAARVSPRLVDLSGIKVDLGNAVFTQGGGQPPRAPEVPFPENFYSYRNNVMSEDDIIQLRIGQDRFPPDKMPFLARGNSTNPGDPPPPAPPPGVPDPPPATSTEMSRGQHLAASALAWLNAIEAWQLGNAGFARQRYASATDAYNRCQQAALDYFSIFPDYNMSFTTETLAARIDELVWHLASDTQSWADVWKGINWRHQLLSLAELGQFDWMPITPGNIVYQLLQGNLKGSDQPPPTNPIGPEHRKILMDTRLVVIAAVLVPLARGEANRLRRQYAASIEDFSRVLRNSVAVPNSTSLFAPAVLRCEFIETPFARLLMAETMLDQAEAQFKTRLRVDDEPDDPTRAQEIAKIGQIAQDFNNRHIPGDPTPGAKPLQHLVAALTYARVLETMQEDGEYVARTKQALNALHASVSSAIASGDVSSIAFRSLGNTITVPTVSAIGNSLPGLGVGTYPHEPYLQFRVPDGQQAMRERNPRVYALLLHVQARLLQIWSGFNYLGYRDDYVPPWRFQYLLDRARYFSEHAKNAQRDYLNFLSNAENEEFKEMSAAQNVDLEKANVQIEAARVDQAQKEVTASQESANLAALNASDAHQRVENYREFDTEMSVFESTSLASSVVGAIITANPTKMSDTATEVDKAWAQRKLERENLDLAVGEANQASTVAKKQLEVAQAGQIVAGLQCKAACLRHEFALQNLQFMRNQTLNTEQWYRLVAGIRSVSDTYLRYAIETAFLAQQAYNFESDKRLNVIRFDYDLSDVGAMLAADFLIRDLDSLEQDLIVSQQTRLQQVRYVLSMAREFSETLRALGDTGEVMFSMRLEQLERHFPGLTNLRISSVDVQPVALMDPTRVSVEFTHLGTGMIRLKGQPGTSPLNSTDLTTDGDWLPNAGTNWPVKIHVSGPETAVFSGLSRQEAASLNTTTANERGAFEGLPGGSGWRIAMSMKDNQVVPGTLADLLITFALSGYYDPQFRDLIDRAPVRSLATTSFISARRALPDGYYSLVHSGKLDWDIPERMLTLTGTPNALRNLAVMLPLSPQGVELGRCYCRYPVEIDIAADGSINVLTAFPDFTSTTNALTLHCTFTGPNDTGATWDFGDGSTLVQGLDVQHRYSRPGRYEVLTRLVRARRLTEYRSTVYVSENHTVSPPLIAVPKIAAATPVPASGPIDLTVTLATALNGVASECAIGKVRAFAASGPLTLKGIERGTPGNPSRVVLDFRATRSLSARLYSKQRFLPADVVPMPRLRVSSNRTFAVAGDTETTTAPNPFTQHLFGTNPSQTIISPSDRWTLELPVNENPWFSGVSSSDIAEFDGSEFDDAVLSLEYTVQSSG